jgi:hypothetical protein
MPGTYVDERTTVANVLAGFAGVPIFWPDTEGDPPSPGSNPEAPVSYVVTEVEHDFAELSDFGGGAEIRGRVALWIWVERNAGDDLVRAHVDTLRGLFAAGDAPPFYFFEPSLASSQIGGENEEWYGRRMDVPFVRFR